MNPTPPPQPSDLSASSAGASASRTRFDWHRADPEARLGVGGLRFTRVRSVVWLLVAAALTGLFYAALAFAPRHPMVSLFTERGFVQVVIVLFFLWCLLMLAVKQLKISRQQAAVSCDDLLPHDPDFVLSPGTVGQVLDRLHAACADPTQYLLFNRLKLTLFNLKNMGRIGDVDDILQSRADHDADVMESSYTLLRGLIWAIPVLGFIGTVQGLSGSLGSFGSVLVDSEDLAAIKPALRDVTSGLSTAFDTTFVALVAALIVQLLLTVTRKREEDLLDDCAEYCQRHVVGRLRLTPFDPTTPTVAPEAPRVAT